MKLMFSGLLECAEKLESAIEKMEEECGRIDIKEILACFTTEVIGSCIFGLDLNAIADKDTPFRRYGRKVLNPSIFTGIRQFFNINFTHLAKIINLHQFSKDIQRFFINSVKDTIAYRENNNVYRKDFMQLMMEIKNENEEFTIEVITAQAFIFFLAGFETSSNAMSLLLYEICLNPDIQSKLRNEINTVLKAHDGKITYDSIKEMEYLDQVLSETLRKYPPVPLLTRKCTKTYKVPNSDLVIEKGKHVLIPIYSYHNDPEYFPEPEKFDPERFSKANKDKIRPFSYIPFGEGPRNCIGLRFGNMQAKVGLVILLKNFEFTLDPACVFDKLVVNPNVLTMAILGKFYMEAKRITEE